MNKEIIETFMTSAWLGSNIQPFSPKLLVVYELAHLFAIRNIGSVAGISNIAFAVGNINFKRCRGFVSDVINSCNN